MPQTPDENLPRALDRLYGAVAVITDPIKELVDGVVMAAPSLWEQLCDDIPAKAGESGGRTHGRSLPPIYCDAVDLKATIDTAVRQWHPHGRSTPERLRRLASGRWRPQDAERLERHADDLTHCPFKPSRTQTAPRD